MSKEKSKNTKKDVKKDGFVKGVKKEIKLVKWPEKKDVFKYTIATIVFCVFVALFFVILTYILSLVKGV